MTSFLSHCLKHAAAPITSAFKHLLSGRTILPVLLNTLSGSELITGTPNKSRAQPARHGHPERYHTSERLCHPHASLFLSSSTQSIQQNASFPRYHCWFELFHHKYSCWGVCLRCPSWCLYNTVSSGSNIYLTFFSLYSSHCFLKAKSAAVCQSTRSAYFCGIHHHWKRGWGVIAATLADELLVNL